MASPAFIGNLESSLDILDKGFVKEITRSVAEEIIQRARTESLSIRSIDVNYAVDLDVFKARMAEITEAFLFSLQRSILNKEAGAGEQNKNSSNDLLTLLCRFYAHGFLLESCTATSLTFSRESELEVRYFSKNEGKKFFTLPPQASPYRVTKITLIVGLNTEGFRNWKCLVQTPTGHPQVSSTSKELCAGNLRGKSLLEQETIPQIIRLLEVPSLDSAYFQPEGLISCSRPPVWQV
jgi:hypothetical protein